MILTLYRNNETTEKKCFYVPTENQIKKKSNISKDVQRIISEMIFDDYYQEYAMNGSLLYTTAFSYTRFKENNQQWESICNEFMTLADNLTINELEEILNTYSDVNFKEIFEQLFCTSITNNDLYMNVNILEEDIILLEIKTKE